MSVPFWLMSVAINGWLLFVVTRKVAPRTLLRRAIIVAVASPVCLVAVILAVAATGVDPSGNFGTPLFQLFFATQILMLVTIAHMIFRGMIETVTDFHRQYNSANLHRFPVSFLIRHPRQLALFAACLWFGGGALMLYGVWFDFRI